MSGQTYTIEKSFGTGWRRIYGGKRFHDFNLAYSVMEAAALQDKGTTYRMRSNGQTVGVPLTFQRAKAVQS